MAANNSGVFDMQWSMNDATKLNEYYNNVYDNVWITTGTGSDDKWCETTPIDWSKITLNTIDEDLPKNKLPEGVEMKNLYDVYMIYVENRKKPVIAKKIGIIANNEEDAKIKSGLMKEIQEEWDSDYLTFICKNIGEVKVKEKPKEVKNI